MISCCLLSVGYQSNALVRILSTDTNHRPLLFNPPDDVPLLGAPRVGVNAEDRRDARLALLAVHHVALVGAADGRDGRRVAAAADRGRRRCRAAAAAVAAPRLLEHRRVHVAAVVGGDGRPERGAVGAVHGVQAGHVDGLLGRGGRGGGGAVQA